MKGRPRQGTVLTTKALRTTHRQLTTVPARLYIGRAPCVGGLRQVDIFSSNLCVVSEASFGDLHPVAAADVWLTETEQIRHVASEHAEVLEDLEFLFV